MSFDTRHKSKVILDGVDRAGARSIEVRSEVHEAFVERVDRRNGEMAWGLSTVNVSPTANEACGPVSLSS